jgi:hypothetical protein
MSQPRVDTHSRSSSTRRFDGHDDITGSHHKCGASPHTTRAGQRADEAKHFLAAFESWRGEAVRALPGLQNA